MGRATSRMGGATSFPYPALPSRFKSLLNTSGNLSDLAVASSQYDILLCSETLAQICITCQSCWFLGSVALSCCAGASCLVPVGWRYMYEMDMEHFANQNLSVVVVKCWLSGFVV